MDHTLTVETVEERRVPPKNNKLGNMLVFDERVTNINGIAGLKGRHSGFAFAERERRYGSVRRDGVCRVYRIGPSSKAARFTLGDSSTSAVALAQSRSPEGPTIT
jgi:hypothetical protein